MAKQETILVLGATGLSGLAFIKEALIHTSNPKLTLLVRNPSKLPEEYLNNPRINIVEGELNDTKALETAMKGIKTVVSFLGAYVSIKAALFRIHTTPIADSFPYVFDAMRKAGVKRILALSTPTGLPQPAKEVKPWNWWAMGWVIWFVAPQGNSEMQKIGEAVSAQNDLEWTVFRMPYFNDGSADLEVHAGYFGDEYKGTTELSRPSLARWVLGEIVDGKWIKEAPLVAN